MARTRSRPQTLLDLNDRRLIALAGERVFERGRAYATQGRVEIEDCELQAVTATVAGTEDYSVGLEFADGELECSCECPAFEDFGFCKHLVATVIVAREQLRSGKVLKPHAANKEATRDHLGTFLRAQPAEQLATWLTELSDAFPEVGERLRLHQSRGDAGALRRQIAALLRPRDFLDWRESAAFAERLDGVIDSIGEVAETDAAQGVDLCEYTVTRLFAIYEQSDDSLGAIGERLHALAELHRRSIGQLPAGGGDLAARLLALQRSDQWDLFPLSHYWVSLESAGQRKYAALVTADFEALPVPCGGSAFGTRWARDFPIVHRMEKLAEQLGDIDLLISVISRDLSSGHAYARLAKICRDAGRAGEALEWAERGYRHHPDWGDMRVLLVQEYRRAGRKDESLALLWEEFQSRPDIEIWRNLKRAAGRDWPDYRRRALSHVEAGERRLPDGRRNASLRLELLIADRDLDAACTLSEQEAADPPVLEHLARAVSGANPIAAAGLLRRVVEATLPRTDAKHYAGVVALVREVQSLQPDAATSWVADLKARFRSRRKLLALLED